MPQPEAYIVKVLAHGSLLIALAVAAFALIATALALAGCGGGDSGEAPAASEVDGAVQATSTAPAGPPFEIADALPSLEQMPTGWTQLPSRKGVGTVCGPPSTFADSVETERRTFAEGGVLPVLDVQVGSFEADAADAAFNATADKLAGCESYMNDGVRFTVMPLSFPRLGDESVAVLQGFEDQGFEPPS